MLHSESPGHWTGALSDTVARGGSTVKRWEGRRRGRKGRMESTMRRVGGEDGERGEGEGENGEEGKRRKRR